MNFNEEMSKELEEFNLGGQLIEIGESEKGTDQDYLDLGTKLSVIDMETTRIVRESKRNTRLGFPCGTMVQTTLKMHEKLGGLPLNEEETISLYLKTDCSSNFVKDNSSNCDLGSENNNLSLKKNTSYSSKRPVGLNCTTSDTGCVNNLRLIKRKYY